MNGGWVHKFYINYLFNYFFCRNLEKRITDNFQFNFAINEISYIFGPGDSRLYWSMPQILTGNQVRSYGGKLEFRQRFNEYGRGRPIQDQDVIIIGDKLTIYWTNPVPLIPDIQNVSNFFHT